MTLRPKFRSEHVRCVERPLSCLTDDATSARLKILSWRVWHAIGWTRFRWEGGPTLLRQKSFVSVKSNPSERAGTRHKTSLMGTKRYCEFYFRAKIFSPGVTRRVLGKRRSWVGRKIEQTHAKLQNHDNCAASQKGTASETSFATVTWQFTHGMCRH